MKAAVYDHLNGCKTILSNENSVIIQKQCIMQQTTETNHPNSNPRKNFSYFSEKNFFSILFVKTNNYNNFHILRLADILPYFYFTTSETMRDYYL